MSMRALVASAVDSAFELAGDLKETATYTRKTNQVFDPDTDTMSGTNTNVTVLGVKSRFSAAEAKNEVNTLTDAIFMFPASAITFTPKKDDTITIDGKVWSVHKIMSVPTALIWKLHIREQ